MPADHLRGRSYAVPDGEVAGPLAAQRERRQRSEGVSMTRCAAGWPALHERIPAAITVVDQKR